MPSVLITSANRGLGFEFAQQYARDGWRVFGACRHPERAHELEGLKRTSDGRVQGPSDGCDGSAERQERRLKGQ
jgi:NAD(P)-dependent dehydrogenase (short-subunit alcohol dehydrogenase family)